MLYHLINRADIPDTNLSLSRRILESGAREQTLARRTKKSRALLRWASEKWRLIRKAWGTDLTRAMRSTQRDVRVQWTVEKGTGYINRNYLKTFFRSAYNQLFSANLWIVYTPSNYCPVKFNYATSHMQPRCLLSDHSASARSDTFAPWCELQEDWIRCVISASKL